MGLYILIVLCVVATGIIFWFANKSPRGYEDETGFHYIEDNETNSNKK